MSCIQWLRRDFSMFCRRRAETLLENAAISVGGTAADLDVIYQKALSILADKSAPPPQALPSEAPPIQAPPGQAPPRQAPPSEALPSQAPPSQAPPSQILSNGAAIRTASPAARTASPAVRTTAQKSVSDYSLPTAYSLLVFQGNTKLCIYYVPQGYPPLILREENRMVCAY